jgi:hypothetical protein
MSEHVEFENTCEDFILWKESMDAITKLMSNIKKNTGYWHVEGKNMGWRNLSGYKNAKASTSEELFSEIMPNTEYNGRVEASPKSLEITLYHHDSPTGEFYSVNPISEKEYYSY